MTLCFKLLLLLEWSGENTSELSSYLHLFVPHLVWGLSRWHSHIESACQCRRCGFDPWVGKITWRRKWQPTPIFLPGKFHGQRSLAGYSPWGLQRVRYNLATKQQQEQVRSRERKDLDQAGEVATIFCWWIESKSRHCSAVRKFLFCLKYIQIYIKKLLGRA